MMDQSQPDNTRIGRMLTRHPDREASCPSHGTFTSKHHFGNIWGRCPGCEAERDAEGREAERKAKESEDRERLERRLRMSGLVGRFKDATFDTFQTFNSGQEHAKTVCRSFVENLEPKTGGLWLVGPPGTGKTHLGSAMVNYVIRERKAWASIYSAREIVRMLRATWGNKDRTRGWDGRATTEEDLIDDLSAQDLLVLDEVGAAFGSDSELVQLFDVLDLRYRKELPTVLLSNLPVGELKSALGDRAYDRLREGAVLLPCKWESHRSSGSNAA
jgi:DNA replication protein DnaC